MCNRLRKLLGVLVATLVCLTTGSVHAHAPGLSSTTVSLGNDLTVLAMTLATQDAETLTNLDIDQDAELNAQEWEQGKVRIAEVIASRTNVYADQRRLHLISATATSDVGSNSLIVILNYEGIPTRAMRLEAGVLDRLPEAHRQAYTVKDARGHVLKETVLTRFSKTFAVALSGDSTTGKTGPGWSVFNDYLRLGIEHILTGYDHLLFLFGLLLVTRRIWDYLGIITCFTLAHSATLALATLNVVALSTDIVEPLIAATIAYVGLENLWSGAQVRHRHWLTFGFGLIHGFGFAGALQEVGIGAQQSNALLVPLFSFNLGVELGQISVAALVMPLFQILQNSQGRVRTHWQLACSLLVTAFGTYWLIERSIAG